MSRGGEAGLLGRVLDGLLPTRRQPAPAMETAGDRRLVLDRAVAAALDLLVCFVVIEAPLLSIVAQLFPAAWEATGGYVFVLTLLVLLPIYSSYGFLLEWRYGRTLGKVNRRLLVVMADGSRCTLRASAVRNLLRYVDLLGVPPLVVGLVAMLAGDGRRVGDYAAGTRVVRSTVPGDAAAPERETEN